LGRLSSSFLKFGNYRRLRHLPRRTAFGVELARTDIPIKRKAAPWAAFLVELIRLVVVVHDHPGVRLSVFFLDDGGLVPRFLFLDDRGAVAISIMIAVIGTHGYAGTYRAHANADMRIFRKRRNGQAKPGSGNQSYSEFHRSFLWSLPSQNQCNRQRPVPNDIREN
jgi:hypothetical protein